MRGVWRCLFGLVVRASTSGVTLDDGSGPAYVYFPDDLPWQHPYVKLGDMWGAQVVVGQYASKCPTRWLSAGASAAHRSKPRAALPAGDGHRLGARSMPG